MSVNVIQDLEKQLVITFVMPCNGPKAATDKDFGISALHDVMNFIT